MTLWRCNICDTLFAVGLPYCPGCTRTDFHEEGSKDVPKISREGGPTYIEDAIAASEERPTDDGPGADNPSNRGGEPRGDDAGLMPRQTLDGEQADKQEVDAEKAKTEDEEGGDSTSPGNSTSASDEKQPTKPAKSATAQKSPAPKTASRSGSTRAAGGSTAPSTGGRQTSSDSKE